MLRAPTTTGVDDLLEHSLFVTTQRRTQLRADLTELADTVHAAFCASVTANY
jgi:hypothetical protein